MFPICWIFLGGEQKRRWLLSMVNGYPWLGSAVVSLRMQTWAVPIQLAFLLPVGRESGLWIIALESLYLKKKNNKSLRVLKWQLSVSFQLIAFYSIMIVRWERLEDKLLNPSSKHLGLELLKWFWCCSFQTAKLGLSSLSRVLYFIECHLLLSCKNQITVQFKWNTGDKQHRWWHKSGLGLAEF